MKRKAQNNQKLKEKLGQRLLEEAVPQEWEVRDTEMFHYGIFFFKQKKSSFFLLQMKSVTFKTKYISQQCDRSAKFVSSLITHRLELK